MAPAELKSEGILKLSQKKKKVMGKKLFCYSIWSHGVPPLVPESIFFIWCIFFGLSEYTIKQFCVFKKKNWVAPLPPRFRLHANKRK